MSTAGEIHMAFLRVLDDDLAEYVPFDVDILTEKGQCLIHS